MEILIDEEERLEFVYRGIGIFISFYQSTWIWSWQVPKSYPISKTYLREVFSSLAPKHTYLDSSAPTKEEAKDYALHFIDLCIWLAREELRSQLKMLERLENNE